MEWVFFPRTEPQAPKLQWICSDIERQGVPFPHTGHWTRGLPPPCRVAHQLSFPWLHVVTATEPLPLQHVTDWAALLIPQQKIYRHLSPHPSGELKEKKNAGRRYSPMFSTRLLQQSWPQAGGAQGRQVISQPLCPHTLALSCTSGTTKWRLEFKRGFQSGGQVRGWRGVPSWRNRRSCTGFGAEQQDCSTRTAQGHSSWHVVLSDCTCGFLLLLFFVGFYRVAVFLFLLLFLFCFCILMHTASIWTRLVGGEVFGSHAGGVLEENETRKQQTNKETEQRSQNE